VRGEKPRELAHILKISALRWQQYQENLDRENPILKGMSRQCVYQLVALVTKLPDQVKDILTSNEDSVIGRYFTERRLRPLTRLDTDEEKQARFQSMVAKLKLPVMKKAEEKVIPLRG
jgi:hypothetical protein